jgi:hypothetical protein
MRCSVTLSLCVLACLGPAALQAQAEADSIAVVGVVTRVFDGMRTRDTALIRSAFTTDARLVNVTVRDGVPTLGAISVDDFVRSIAGAPADVVLDERIYDPEVRIDGRLATVWTWYDLLIGPRWSHCGVDAFQMAKLADGWKITQLADTRHREGCRTPAAPR